MSQHVITWMLGQKGNPDSDGEFAKQDRLYAYYKDDDGNIKKYEMWWEVATAIEFEQDDIIEIKGRVVTTNEITAQGGPGLPIADQGLINFAKRQPELRKEFEEKLGDKDLV